MIEAISTYWSLAVSIVLLSLCLLCEVIRKSHIFPMKLDNSIINIQGIFAMLLIFSLGIAAMHYV